MSTPARHPLAQAQHEACTPAQRESMQQGLRHCGSACDDAQSLRWRVILQQLYFKGLIVYEFARPHPEPHNSPCRISWDDKRVVISKHEKRDSEGLRATSQGLAEGSGTQAASLGFCRKRCTCCSWGSAETLSLKSRKTDSNCCDDALRASVRCRPIVVMPRTLRIPST